MLQRFRATTNSNALSRRFRESGPSFDPTSITGNVLWLDAADTSSMTFSSGSNISEWRDKSGLGNHATGTNSPVLTASAINSYQAIVTSSSSSNYFTGAVSVTGSNVTVFSVAKTTRVQPSAGSDQRLVSLASTGADFNTSTVVIALFNQRDSSEIKTFRGGAFAGRTITQNVPFQAVSKYDGVNGTLWKDGVLGGSSESTGTFSITKYGIGNQANPSGEYWNGAIGEVLVYNIALNDTHRQTIEGYLATKWSI
jgi:hypothetical protein